jgi:glycosyltransferase involved in cell wall biosynthesis
MADKRKIILAVTTDLNYDQRMQRICNSLCAASYEVLLLGREKADSLPLKKEAYQQHRLRLWAQKGPLFYLFFNLRLFIYLIRNRSEIVCAVDLDTVLAVGLIKWLRPSVKVVFDAHEYFTEVPELQGRKSIQRIWNAVGDSFVPTFDAAYTVGPALADMFAEKYKIDFKTVRNLSVLRSSQDTLRNTEPFILYYQGALNAGRGLEEMIEAIELLDARCHLYVAGEGDLSEQLRALVRDKGLESRVKFLGYLLPEDLQKWLKVASLGLNLLEHKGLSYFYSLANKTFDYIQAELPAVHMAFPEYQALQDQWNCFYLQNSLEPEDLANSIRGIMNDMDLYEEKQAHCRKAKVSLNWEMESKALIQIYDAL